MRLCNDGHDEICYEGYQCPACKLLDQITELKDEVADLQSELNDLRSELENL